ncbi:MAG: ATP-binding protein [Candidatus Omnitrophica bacterium]|nr:ATP-binding protein [Candidatus Omnitrophota bacterium]
MLSDPVVGHDFYGREDILDTLRKRAGAFVDGYRQNVALISQPHMGKTSIAHHFLTTFNSESVVPLYIPLQTSDLPSLVEQTCRRLLYRYLTKFSDVGPEECLDVLTALSDSKLPTTTKLIKAMQHGFKKRDNNLTYEQLLKLFGIFNSETSMKCLIVIDEFQRLDEMGIREPFKNFGKHIMVQKDSLYIFISSDPQKANEILSEKLSLLFGNFEKITLGEFSFDVANSFVQKKLEPVGSSVAYRKYLIAYTDGHPFYLNVICRSLKALAESEFRPYIDSALIAESLKRVLFDAEGTLNQHFLNRISAALPDESRQLAMRILVCIAGGLTKSKVIAGSLHKSQKEVSGLLVEMHSKGLIAKSGSFYYFEDRVFKAWIKTVYRHREMSLHIDMPSKAEYFFKDCHEDMSIFINDSDRKDGGRIAELFRRFDNDMVEIESKTKRIPSFEAVELGSQDNRLGCETLMATTQKKNKWVCRIAHQSVTEDNVHDLLSAGSAEEKKQKKVLIVLQGIDAAARVIAKNHFSWILDLRDVNDLMEYYGMSKIVRLPAETSQPEPLFTI